MIVRKCANRGTLPCRDEGNPVLSYMILNYNCFKYYEDYMESQSTSKSYIRRFGVENKVSDKDTRSE